MIKIFQVFALIFSLTLSSAFAAPANMDEDLTELKTEKSFLESRLIKLLDKGVDTSSLEVVELQTRVDNLQEQIIEAESMAVTSLKGSSSGNDA